MIEKLDEDEAIGKDHIVYSYRNRRKINETIDAITKLQEDIKWIGKINDIKK